MSGRRSRRRRQHRKVPSRAVPTPQTVPPAATGRPERVLPLLAAVVAAAALVRLAATWNDLWLDEIWTLKLLRDVHSFLGVFTLRHENNHILNTLFLYALRPLGNDWLYRVPDWLAASAVTGVGAWIAWLGDGHPDKSDAPPRIRAVVAAILLGGSYMLVHYGSEARGYSLALCLGFLSVGIALADGPRPLSARAPLAWLTIVLAMLALALAVHFLVALIAWSAVRSFRRGGLRDAVITLGWWYAVPVAFLFFYYVKFLSVMGSAGGPMIGIPAAVGSAIAGATGLPLSLPTAAYLLFGIAVTGIGLTWLAARGSDLWVLFLFGMILSPVVVAAAHRPELYVGRHFLITVALGLVLSSRLLAWAWSRGGGAKAFAAATVFLFLVANAARTVPLVRYGRGTPRAALAYMAERIEGSEVRLIGDQDTRNSIVIEYFAPRVDPRIRYLKRRQRTVAGADWYVACLPAPPNGPPAVMTDGHRNRYRFDTEFPANPYGGIPLRLYRRVESASSAQSLP